MRIGIFSECYHPTLNGVTVSIDSFMEILGKKHEYFIFAPAARHFRDIEKNIFRYPSTTLFGPNDYPIALPFLAPSIKKKVKALGLDIIHAQHSLGMLSAAGLKFARQTNIPIVHTYHTLLVEYAPSIATGYIKSKSTAFCNQCDQVITPSDAMKEIILGYGVKTPIETIPTGISLDDFQHPYSRDELFDRWQIPRDKKLLLYLSRVAKEKNLDFLFDAIKMLSQKRHDFHLVLVGGGKELPVYQNKAKALGLGSVITFTDKQEKENANRFFGIGPFVFPSLTETQGIVVSETMAAGTPAVAINKMGPNDIIKDGVDGFLCNLNLEQFSGKIEKLLDDEILCQKMGAAARENAKEFSKQVCAARMEKLYEKTIANHHHRS